VIKPSDKIVRSSGGWIFGCRENYRGVSIEIYENCVKMWSELNFKNVQNFVANMYTSKIVPE